MILSYWFGIYSKIKKCKQQYTNNRGSENILPAWEITMNADDSILFAKHIPMYIGYKQERLDYYKSYKTTRKAENLIPYYNVKGEYMIVNKKDGYELFPDVKFCKVANIKGISNPTAFVYDLTVEKTRTFYTANSLGFFDTFHFSGVGEKSSVTAGVPRLHELLSNTKNPKNPSCRIYLNPEIRHDKEKCNKIRNNLELTTIKDILLSSAIYLEPNNEPTNILPEDRPIMAIYQVFSEINPLAAQIPNNPWVIRLEFDHHKILEQRINMTDIYHILSLNYPEAFLMYHDNNAAKLVFRIRMNIESKTTEDDILLLKSKIQEIEGIVIKGVDDIKKVWPPSETAIYQRKGDIYVEEKEYYLDTDGSNLFDLLIRDGVDATRTFSVDPNDMLGVFGIEAARFMIENQLRVLLESNDAKTSQRHLSLLCNKMCQRGSIMQVDRHGINRENIGPLAKCSFEETSVQLQEASLFGVADDIKGVSSNIMVGQIPSCGTGESEVLLDEEMLLSRITEDVAPIKEDEGPSFDEFMKEDPVCASASTIKFSLTNIEGDDIDFGALPTFTL